MRAVVTGGAGFIGSHVVDALLARGDEVHVVDNLSTGKRERVPADGAPCTSATSASRSTQLFEELRPDVVFHLAAQADVRVSVERPGLRRRGERRRHDPRARGGARPVGAQVVFARPAARSTASATTPAPEDDAAASRSRRTARRSSAARSTSRPTTACYAHATRRAALRQRLRPAPGPARRGRRRRDLLRPAARRRDAERSSATARQTRDYVYVGDVARATLAAVGHDGGVFNVGTGVETSVARALRSVPRASPASDVEPEHARGRAPASCSAACSIRLSPPASLGWRAETSLEEGLRATWRSGEA